MEEREFVLPEDIIHRIQSFLTGKQAAQTTIFSKSWYGAWLTRPNLDFDQRDFNNRGNGVSRFQKTDNGFVGFAGFAMKTLQRYDELNLKIESFKLCTNRWDFGSHSLANEVIVKALKIGAIDLNLEYFSRIPWYDLPCEVFGSETLTRLSVAGCRIEYGKVSCSRLESLSLCDVEVQGDVILDVLSSCPLIEELVLRECNCFTKVRNFNRVSTNVRMMALSPLVEFKKQHEKCGVNGPINLFELHKLKKMFLEKVKVSTFFFNDFSSKFPCLKDLTVHYCYGYNKEIRIHSLSLERISFAQNWILKANFNVPSVKKFTFSGSIPYVSFETGSRGREWESLLFIRCDNLYASWFHRLNKLLTNLSLSRVTLSLDFGRLEENSYNYMGGFCKPKVENLTIRVLGPLSNCYALLNSLFSSCHPKFITQPWLPKSCTGLVEKANGNLLMLLCETLVQEEGENCYILSGKSSTCLRDLEQINVELFEKALVVWQPLSLKALEDASARKKYERVVRFRLSWRV